MPGEANVRSDVGRVTFAVHPWGPLSNRPIAVKRTPYR